MRAFSVIREEKTVNIRRVVSLNEKILNYQQLELYELLVGRESDYTRSSSKSILQNLALEEYRSQICQVDTERTQ